MRLPVTGNRTNSSNCNQVTTISYLRRIHPADAEKIIWIRSIKCETSCIPGATGIRLKRLLLRLRPHPVRIGTGMMEWPVAASPNETILNRQG